MEVVGAAIILAGAVLSVMNQVLHPASSDDDKNQVHWYCILFYLASNIPMACSANYKERNFSEVCSRLHTQGSTSHPVHRLI